MNDFDSWLTWEQTAEDLGFFAYQMEAFARRNVKEYGHPYLLGVETPEGIRFWQPAVERFSCEIDDAVGEAYEGEKPPFWLMFIEDQDKCWPYREMADHLERRLAELQYDRALEESYSTDS